MPFCYQEPSTPVSAVIIYCTVKHQKYLKLEADVINVIKDLIISLMPALILKWRVANGLWIYVNSLELSPRLLRQRGSKRETI